MPSWASVKACGYYRGNVLILLDYSLSFSKSLWLSPSLSPPPPAAPALPTNISVSVASGSPDVSNPIPVFVCLLYFRSRLICIHPSDYSLVSCCFSFSSGLSAANPKSFRTRLSGDGSDNELCFHRLKRPTGVKALVYNID